MSSKKISRRNFALGSAAIGASAWALSSCASAPQQSASAATASGASARVVVVGGGFGGATCAKYVKMMAPNVDVTLVERDRAYYTCPFSNLVLGGVKQLPDIEHNYETLASKYGINVVHANATNVSDSSVTLADGSKLDFDRAVVAPGIDFRPEQVEGYQLSDAEIIPHSWKAGEQTSLLRRQIESMPDDGVVLICPPANPFRCPPGPYERASMIAHYLKNNKPRAKIVILDQKDKFSKQGLFQQGWDLHYGDMIEWRGSGAGGAPLAVDARGKRIDTDFGWESGDVVNFIPAQYAGKIARDSGLTNDAGWCPVNQKTFASDLVDNVHVIGDACIAGKMPKSGFSANSQAKITAAAIVAELNGEDPLSPSFANTCYSLVTPDYGISVAAVYKLGDDNTIVSVAGAGGVSPSDAGVKDRALEAVYAQGWYDAITQDMFA